MPQKKSSIIVPALLVVVMIIGFGWRQSLFSADSSGFTGRLVEEAAGLEQIASIDIGDAGAAEILCYDSSTRQVFIVTNTKGRSGIDILNISDPSKPKKTGFIDILPYGAGINSVDVHNGILAAAIEASARTSPGKILFFNTGDLSHLHTVEVGVLPDMVSFSPDGRYLLSANEGEPDNEYRDDPAGSVSIVDLQNEFAVHNILFDDEEINREKLLAGGFRAFGPLGGFSQDIEPEYLTISPDSKTAWVCLQENNAIARVDINSKKITALFPLGFKDFTIPGNGIDADQNDKKYKPAAIPVWGMYQPDAIAVLEKDGIPYLITANEGDTRDYKGFSELIKAEQYHKLEGGEMPDIPASLQVSKSMMGYSSIAKRPFSFGARSFSIWNGLDGTLVFDSGNELEKEAAAAGLYNDIYSPQKGVEPEGVCLGKMNGRDIAFIGLEKANAIAVYDITNPVSPEFIKLLPCGKGPEGLSFVPSTESPNGKSLLIVTGEKDGVVTFYQGTDD